MESQAGDLRMKKATFQSEIVGVLRTTPTSRFFTPVKVEGLSP